MPLVDQHQRSQSIRTVRCVCRQTVTPAAVAFGCRCGDSRTAVYDAPLHRLSTLIHPLCTLASTCCAMTPSLACQQTGHSLPKHARAPPCSFHSHPSPSLLNHPPSTKHHALQQQSAAPTNSPHLTSPSTSNSNSDPHNSTQPSPRPPPPTPTPLLPARCRPRLLLRGRGGAEGWSMVDGGVWSVRRAAAGVVLCCVRRWAVTGSGSGR